jgi:hypothetical protein
MLRRDYIFSIFTIIQTMPVKTKTRLLGQTSSIQADEPPRQSPPAEETPLAAAPRIEKRKINLSDEERERRRVALAKAREIRSVNVAARKAQEEELLIAKQKEAKARLEKKVDRLAKKRSLEELSRIIEPSDDDESSDASIEIPDVPRRAPPIRKKASRSKRPASVVYIDAGSSTEDEEEQEVVEVKKRVRKPAPPRKPVLPTVTFC